MNRTCDYCRGPCTTSSVLGRPWPNQVAATYCCFGCLSLGEADRQAERQPAPSSFRLDGFALRLGIGLLVASQSMIFGLAINLEEQTPASVKWGVQCVILLGTVLVLALLGPPLFRTAITELRRGRLTIEALFLVTMSGAIAASLQSFITGRGPIYFEVVTVLLVVYSLGKAIGARSRAAALSSARLWAGSLETCRVIGPQGLQSVEVISIRSGDFVEVRPGEAIAIDGVIREGTGFVSEAAVSGEPFPVVRRPGDAVLAGAIAHDAVFRIEATAPGTARQIDQLLTAVEQARFRPFSWQAQSERLARLFLPLILGTAVLTFLVWTLIAGWSVGLFNSMSVLLVACPCALGLATPIVLWSTLNRLAERGIVIHSGDAIERLAQIDCVVFDKTGTLTEDRFALLDVATFATGDERARILGWLSLVEEQSQHPIARPFADLPRHFASDIGPRVDAMNVVPGCGITACIDGRTMRVGRPEWIQSSQESELNALLLVHDGHRVAFELDGKLAALAIVTERLRESVPETLLDLKKLHLPVTVLSGDTTERTLALGLPNSQGDLRPEDKCRRLEEMKQAGAKPLMIGDGINDASALATARASIALASGTDLANSAADATLHHGDLRVIPWAIALSQEALRTVRRNLWRAAGYNVIGITLAAFGVLHPVAAALLMVMSSLLVAWSSVRVGVAAEIRHCPEPTTESLKDERMLWNKGLVHLFAFAGQIALTYILVPFSPIVAAAMFVLALVFTWLWIRANSLSHSLDMAFGMLTLGNFGMLLGWWADNGFRALPQGCCCECAAALTEGILRPWMWIGMLAFANLAMMFLGRRSIPDVPGHKFAMFTGGNMGMIAGMFAGGWLVAFAQIESITIAFGLSFFGMTIGMIAGMLLGTAAAEQVRFKMSRICSQAETSHDTSLV